MARQPKLWKWKARGVWCAVINGERQTFGPNKEQAEIAFKQAMKDYGKRTAVRGSVAEWFDVFLDNKKTSGAKPLTMDSYVFFIKSFCQHPYAPGKYIGDLHLTQLKPLHVTNWIAAHPTWKKCKPLAVQRIKAAVNFLVDNKYISRDEVDLSSVKPLRSKPSRKWVKPEEHATILANTKDQNFRDIINFYWFTGCRSYEAYRLRLRHLELTPDYNRAVIPCEEMPLHKTEAGRPRIVYIPDEAMEIVRRLTATMTDPEEFVFKTRKGKPWKRNTLNNRFERLKDTLGRRLSPYAYRHAFGTRKRAEGKIADLDLAYLMGHQDLSMLKDYYDHAQEMAEDMARKANL